MRQIILMLMAVVLASTAAAITLDGCSTKNLCYNQDNETFCSPDDDSCRLMRFTLDDGECRLSSLEVDSDSDSWSDSCDAFRFNSSEWVDYDADGVGHNEDCDDLDADLGVCPYSDPIADAGGPYNATEGQEILFNANASYDPDNDTLEYRWDLDGDGVDDTGWLNASTYQYAYSDDYCGNVTVEVKDSMNATGSDTTDVCVQNEDPVADAGGPYECVTGDNITLTGSFTDAGDDNHTFAWDLDSDGSYDDSYDMETYFDCNETGVFNVSLAVTDDDEGTGSSDATVAVSEPEEEDSGGSGGDTQTSSKDEVESVSSSSSSGGGGKHCWHRWSCSDWSMCVAGEQSRVCEYIGNCPDDKRARPDETQSCEVKVDESEERQSAVKEDQEQAVEDEEPQETAEERKDEPEESNLITGNVGRDIQKRLPFPWYILLLLGASVWWYGKREEVSRQFR